ncbi:MAG TPA: hypothetical protein VGF75_03735 [Candidatus Saccharimonadales bacterium]|jgi:hypothetical protein
MPKSKLKTGRIIIPNGIYPEKHELATANVFTKLGKDMEFLAPSKTRHARTPDVMIEGVIWEIKSPTGSSRYTIQNQFKRAAQQSQNLILDGRRIKLQVEYIEKEVAKQISLRKSIRKLKLITKTGRFGTITDTGDMSSLEMDSLCLLF